MLIWHVAAYVDTTSRQPDAFSIFIPIDSTASFTVYLYTAQLWEQIWIWAWGRSAKVTARVKTDSGNFLSAKVFPRDRSKDASRFQSSSAFSPFMTPSIKTMDLETVEDILNDALELMGADRADLDDEDLSYGPVSVAVAPKVSVAVFELHARTVCATGQFVDSALDALHQGRESKPCLPSLTTQQEFNGRFTKANTLLADHIFSPSLLLAERIERGLISVAGRNST
jgi:hypothetical protein